MRGKLLSLLFFTPSITNCTLKEDHDKQQMLTEVGDEAIPSEHGWGVSVIDRWETIMKKKNPETLEYLMELAKESHKQ
ncbi:MAG: hypothetical protein MI975_10115 [Cytophagales bacterium]|nr:hypothetical protein [Cytophagales bacterium]